MNFYMLVEGEKTEVAFYPILFKHYKPQYQKVNNLKDINKNNFYIFSGGGMPNLIKKIKPSLIDINNFNTQHSSRIDCFVIVIDGDIFSNLSVANQCIYNELEEYKEFTSKIKVLIIIQNRCIESWFLANTNLFPKIYSKKFGDLVRIYDIRKFDPEYLPKIKGKSEGKSAKYYLSLMLKQSNKYYSESYLDDVLEGNCIQIIENRCKKMKHIQSYNAVLDLINLM